MLRMIDRDTQNSQRLSRRSFLEIGSLAAGGLTLPWLLSQKSQAGSVDSDFVRDKSVIFLFLHGGPSQYETFDPFVRRSRRRCASMESAGWRVVALSGASGETGGDRSHAARQSAHAECIRRACPVCVSAGRIGPKSVSWI